MESAETFEVGIETEALAATTSQRPDQEREPLLNGKDTHDTERGEGVGGAFTQIPAKDFEGLPWWKVPSIWWLLVPFFFFALAFGGTVVIKINIILGLICKDYLDHSVAPPSMPVLVGSDNKQCQIPEIHSLVAKFTLYGTLISGILSAFISPKLGALSDRYGRTYLMAASTFCLLINELIFLIVARCGGMISINYILLGFVFDGLGGSFIAVMAISYAYASDCTPPEKRNVAFGYYIGCFFGGGALGPLCGGLIVKATGDVLSIFYIALAVHALFFLDLLFIVPESLSQERQLAARKVHAGLSKASGAAEGKDNGWLGKLKSALRASNVLAPLTILWPTEPGTSHLLRRNIALIAAVDTIIFGIAMGAITVTLIYSELMFGWGNLETSIYLSIVNTCRVLVLFGILPLVNHVFIKMGWRKTKASGSDSFEIAIIRIAIIFDLLGFIGFATVRTGELFIAAGVLASLGSMGSPTLGSALTKHVRPERVGQVLGAMGLLHACARIVAPLIFQLIYAATVGKFTQTVFVSLAVTWGLALMLSMFIRPHVHFDETAMMEPDIDENNDFNDSNMNAR